MDNSAVHPSNCDGCGKLMAKAKRTYEGLRYCDGCYRKRFKNRVCHGCGNQARLFIKDPLAICTKCLNGRPCIRCRRVGRPVGKVTAQGPVCNSCANYIEASGHCEICNKFSIRLANKTIDGQVRRCCTGCSNVSSATCPCCRRYRVLVESASGAMQCKLCSELGEVACQVCSKSMPAGLGRECTNCYWRRTFHKRLKINSEGFSSQTFREEFKAYGLWFIDQIDAKKGALLINKHMLFFVEMAQHWSCLPSYDQLLKAFGADWLRRAKYPVQWMTACRNLVINDELKKSETELRRIEVILASARSGSSSALLKGYHDVLTARAAVRKTSLATIRTSLRSAANLLALGEASKSGLSSKTLRNLLIDTPGTAASLVAFVNYLNKTLNLSIEFPDPGETKKLSREKQGHGLLALIHQALTGTDVMEQWLPAALNYFHGVSRFKKSDATTVSDGDDLLVTVGETEFCIPSPTSGFKME